MSAPVTGPFATEREAREDPAVWAIYEAALTAWQPGALGEGNRRILSEALGGAGVKLGAYDARIVNWLAGYEPTTCAVVAGLITRAAAKLAAGDLGTVLEALDVAADRKRDLVEVCGDCQYDPDGRCGTCTSRLERADAYDALAAKLGGAR